MHNRGTQAMKYKIIIIIGLAFLTLSLSSLPAAAHISEEEALQQTARETGLLSDMMTMTL